MQVKIIDYKSKLFAYKPYDFLVKEKEIKERVSFSQKIVIICSRKKAGFHYKHNYWLYKLAKILATYYW